MTAQMASAHITEQEPQTAGTAHEPQKALPPPHETGPGESAGGGFRKWLVILVILLAVGGAIWKIRRNTADQAVQGQRLAAAADRPVPVSVQPVQQRNIPIYLTQLGTVTAYNTVTVKTRVDGQLLRVNVREGQSVRKGQLLAEIDPRPYLAALAQAQGQLTKDQANAKNADAEAQRYTALLDAGVVSRESQQSQVSTAGQATGAIQADQAAIQAAQVNVTYSRITSPIDGVVGLRQVDPGNIVHAADTTGLIVVTQLQPIAVIFTLPEDQLPEVLKLTRGGHTLTVEAFDRSETTHLDTGTLLTLDNQIDPTTGTVKGKAVFNNQAGALFPNQFVNIRLVLQERKNAIVVPTAAIQTGADGNFVYVVKPGDPPAELQGDRGGNSPAAGGKKSRRGAAGGGGAANGAGQRSSGPSYYAEVRPVKVALTQGTQVVLDAGVNPGEQIVVDGQEKLRNGSRVVPKQGPPASTTARSVGSGSTGGTVTGKAKDTPRTRAQHDGTQAAPQGNGGQPQ